MKALEGLRAIQLQGRHSGGAGTRMAADREMIGTARITSDERAVSFRSIPIFLGLALDFLIATISLGATLVVTNTSDLVNGDTSSPAALIANPGPDGISLREAIEAADNAPGPHTISISPALTGQVITLGTSVLWVRRDGIDLEGLAGSDGQPAITIDSTAVQGGPAVLNVGASNFTLRNVRFQPISLQAEAALKIEAGDASADAQEEQVVSNIVIDHNAFANTGVSPNPVHQFGPHGIAVGTAPFPRTSTNAVVSNHNFEQHICRPRERHQRRPLRHRRE